MLKPELQIRKNILIEFKFEFANDLQFEVEFLIFNSASSSSSSVIFIEFMLSSSSFCQVHRFKTQSAFFEFEFKFEFNHFCFFQFKFDKNERI